MHSTPVLLAPRPVRLTSDTTNTLFTTRSPHHPLRHSQSSPRIRTVPLDSSMRKEQITTINTSSSVSNHGNTLVRQELSQSPRPEEALEEFLSIFRSTTTASPPPTTSFLFSPSPTTMRALMPYGSTLFAVEEVSASSSWSGSGVGSPIQGHVEEGEVGDVGTSLEVKQNRWFSSHLSSPISRTNTRNPFQRHPSYDIVVIPSARPASRSCSRLSSCTSPANIPLPPTPAPEVTA